ncbi:MAG TPA: pimeloyl-CoA dehydrogenase small subunit [Gammaproteobacteria bacterium]|jgi:alkylation response protein AidB-like acyl-CoA dehydrogenase|nr:pimeloyl-CoA dehydrogenase small subunit [Gammaproteobacteria bacterium]
MDFSFNEEQTLIQRQVAQFIQRDYEWEKRQALAKSELGFSSENWKIFADLGWLGISLSEESGGFGGSALETMIIMEEFGKGLVVEPFLETIVLCAGLIDSCGNKDQKSEILKKVISGEMHLALGFVEPQSRFNLADVTTEAKKKGDGFVLNGFKSVVMNGPSANNIIISARISGKQSEEEGISLFVVDPKLEGVSLRNYPTVDGRRASEITLENVDVTSSCLLAEEGKGFKELEKAIDSATLAICAEAIGAMEVLYKTTVEYTKIRKQFGQAIGKFQVLQHRMVDMFMEYEQSKSLLYMATIKQAEKAEDSKKAISGLKYQVGKAAKFIGQQAVQLHGGMGVTDELNVGHFFKRLTTIITIFGNTDYHLKRYSQL